MLGSDKNYNLNQISSIRSADIMFDQNRSYLNKPSIWNLHSQTKLIRPTSIRKSTISLVKKKLVPFIRVANYRHLLNSVIRSSHDILCYTTSVRCKILSVGSQPVYALAVQLCNYIAIYLLTPLSWARKERAIRDAVAYLCKKSTRVDPRKNQIITILLLWIFISTYHISLRIWCIC